VQNLVSAEDPAGGKILANQIATDEGRNVTPQNAPQFAKAVASEAQVVAESFKGGDGVERLRVKVHVPMVPDHLKRRSRQYVSDVRTFCDKYELDIAMVMALIHTESYFNPVARSHAPAYGLMQLVPRSGGREAYRYVFGVDKQPSPSYLYTPKNNIQLGIAYLHKIRTNEFKNVRDSQSALYCIICAYNTGPGNVAKAFTGKMNVDAAVNRINQMQSEAVYNHLVRNLPYKETRDYIQRIYDRAGNYVALR